MTHTQARSDLPEIWGGVECTVNRVGDLYKDQMDLSGHRDRLEDLDLFAALGIRALRYPVHWERFVPESEGSAIDWSWADLRLGRIRDLGVRPIVGLLHHGSGPACTSLVDPNFAEGLVRYARQVAERFPWVEEWTPINEPLTTARFSGLYGHWYPHGVEEPTFIRALLQQCRATALAMQAIRTINPAARLIQTEDLGKIHSTPQMRYQAEFENERRWLAWDLLCGRVDHGHPLWGYLLWAGASEADLNWLGEHPCPPDVIGIDHYLTSERFLDERTEQYPNAVCGSNGRERYADVEAVRVRSCASLGLRGIIEEAWERYRKPIAITEVHLGCTREEQMRWLQEVWETAVAARADGVDVRAVTAWALLGSYDWNSMLTRSEGHYESGVFDMRGGVPRPTALAAQIRCMAQGLRPDHPVLVAPGWWRRPKRILYAPDAMPSGGEDPSLPSQLPQQAGEGAEMCVKEKRCHLGGMPSSHVHPVEERPLLILGADGPLGAAFARLCDHRHLAHIALRHAEADRSDLRALRRALIRSRPWALIDATENEPVDRTSLQEAFYRIDVGEAAQIARLCAQRQIRLLTFSSDLVFDGGKTCPYVESDPCDCIHLYGRRQAKSEQRVQELLPSALIVRSGPLFGPWDTHNFVTRLLLTLGAGENRAVISDTSVSPTYIPDLVHACLDLLIDGEQGILHLANQGSVSWLELARMAADLAGFDPHRIQGQPQRTFLLPLPLPRNLTLSSERAPFLQSLEGALQCFFRDCEIRWDAPYVRLEDASLRSHTSVKEERGGATYGTRPL